MRKNFKGYTLVELLLSLAVFSVVMIVIGSMVSSTTAVYRDENFELTMQEDASLVMAQLDELLMDATQFSGSGPYSITNAGTNYTISTSGNQLYITKTVAGSPVTEILSDCISADSNSFVIKGYTQNTSSNDCDNAVLVSIDFEKSGYTYHSEKQVYFRNNLENANVNTITSVIGTTTTTSGTSSTPECDVKRYGIVDLNTKYNTEGGWEFVGSGGDYNLFTFCKKDGSALGNGDSKEYIKLVDSVNTSYTTSKDKTANIKIKNSLSSKEVYLTIDAVEFTYGSGVLVYPAIKSNHGGIDSFDIKGLDLYRLNEVKPNTVKVDYIIYYDSDNDMVFDSGEDGKIWDQLHNAVSATGQNCNPGDFNKKDYKGLGKFYINDNGVPEINKGQPSGPWLNFEYFKFNVVVCADEIDRGYTISYDPGMELEKYGCNNLADGKFRALVKFDLPDAPKNTSNKKKIYCLDFQTYCAGNVMNNKQGGRSFDEWK